MDYGTAVSQKGYDVKTCADRFLIYSAAFQTLKVFSVSSVTTTIPASGTNTITISHNLGYIPPYLIIYNGSTTVGTTISYYNGVDSTNTVVYDDRCNTTQLTIGIPDTWESSGSGDTVYFTVYIFVDDFTTVSENTINSGISSGASSSDYGFRISKPGYDVKTAEDIDCVISSSAAFTQLVHKKGYAVSAGGGIETITHDLGYMPALLGFVKETGNTYISSSQASGNDSDIQSYSLNAGDTFYYIIFKNRNE